MSYITRGQVKDALDDVLPDDTVQMIMDSAIVDVDRIAGGAYPITLPSGAMFDVHAVVTGISGTSISTRIDTGGWLSFGRKMRGGNLQPYRDYNYSFSARRFVDRDALPPLHRFTLDTAGTWTAIFRARDKAEVPEELWWTVVPGASYEPDEWESATDTDGGRYTLTAELDYTDDQTATAALFAALAVGDEIRLIAGEEPARMFMSQAEYDAKKAQLVVDLCKIVAADRGVLSTSVKTEGVAQVDRNFASMSSEYEMRLRAAQYLRSPI